MPHGSAPGLDTRAIVGVTRTMGPVWEFTGPVRSARARGILVGVYFSICLVYFAWRVGFSMNLTTPMTTVYSLVFIGAEIALFLLAIPFYVNLSSGVRRGTPPAPPAGVSVDALICTYNEDISLVRTSAVAARALRGDCRVWICDDGHRPEMAALAAELGVGYLTRPDNQHAKSGNLNNALRQTTGDLVLVLDADHVVRPQLLERTVGHFRDPMVALIQIPQIYYNLESFQHLMRYDDQRLWHESALFHHLMQPGADRRNTAFFVGTGAVLRRSALEDIGGFATGTITEDVHTSMRLHAKGYRSVYVDEALGVMMSAETPFAYVLQRLRWAQGSMQVLARERPFWKKGLTAWQRYAYTVSLANWLAAWIRALFYLAPGIFLLTALSPIDAQLSAALVVFAAKITIDIAMFSLFASPHARMFVSECFHLITTPIGLVATSTLLRPREKPFKVTPKGAHHGLPALVVWPLVFVAAFNIAALATGIWRVAAGQLPIAAVSLAAPFAAWFAAAACWMLLYTWRRRASLEAYTFPVSLPARIVSVNDERTVEIVRLNGSVAYVRSGWRSEVGEVLDLEDLLDLGLWVDGRVVSIQPDPSGRPGWLLKLVFTDQMRGPALDAVEGYLFDSVLPSFLNRRKSTPPGPPPEHTCTIPDNDAYALVPRLL